MFGKKKHETIFENVIASQFTLPSVGVCVCVCMYACACVCGTREYSKQIYRAQSYNGESVSTKTVVLLCVCVLFCWSVCIDGASTSCLSGVTQFVNINLWKQAQTFQTRTMTLQAAGSGSHLTDLSAFTRYISVFITNLSHLFMTNQPISASFTHFSPSSGWFDELIYMI